MVVAMIGVMGSIAASRLLPAIGRPTSVDGAAKELASNLRLARTFSISRNGHYRVLITSPTQYGIQRMVFNAGTNCWDFQRTEAGPFTLPTPAEFNPAGVGAEFDARGILSQLSQPKPTCLPQPAALVTFNIQDTGIAIAKAVQVLPSGQVLRTAGTVN